MMKRFYILFIGVFVAAQLWAQSEMFSAKDLDNWGFYGIGSKVVDNHDIFLMKEAENNSKGAMIFSPKAYGENVVLNYDVMALTPATNLVAILSISALGESGNLTIADGYDGANGKWGADTVQCYFFAFRNEAHNHRPFLRKRINPQPEKGWFVEYEHHKNVMQCGIFHSVEVGRKRNKIWLKIDGKKIINYKDEKPFSGGHFAIRIRGTAGEYAACFIRNVEIIEKD